MPEKNRSALRAGLLMVGSLALILCVVVGVKGLSWISDKTVVHLVAFDLKTNIGGLRVGDEVRIGGFKVGEVKHISVERLDDPKGPPGIVIAFTMPEKYVVREDAVLIRDSTVTGSSWLDFETLGTGKPLPAATPLIGRPNALSQALSQVASAAGDFTAIVADIKTKTIPLANQTLDKFGQTADAFKKTGENATALTTDIRVSYKPIVEKYTAVTDKAVAALEAIRAMFGESSDDFKTTIANLKKATDTVNAKLPAIMQKVDDALAKANTAVDGVNKTMADVQATMASAKDLAANAKAVVVGNKTKLDTMIASLKTAGDNLKEATAEIRRSPWRLLYKPAPNEMANLNVYDAARQFSEGAGQLNDAAGALRDAIKNNQTTPEELKKLMEKVDQSFSNFKQVEDKLYGSVKE
jgi:ABC-type transporter Mla subunit MlaD